jgi:hypothetical protein
MARRGFGGMTALRAALGAATGVGQGLQQREVLAEQRRKEAEEAMFRRIQAGLTPVEDVLPQEQGNIGPMATKPAAPPPMSPATLGQAIAQRTQVPAGGPGLTAPPAFGTPAPERQMSNVERVMGDFRSRPQRTFREGGQRYALPRTPEENTLLSVALQQAMQQDTKAAEVAQLEDRAKALAATPQFGGDLNKARMVLSGVDAGVLGIETASPMQRRVSEANIRQSDASAAASLAARDAAKASKSGAMTERDINEAIARYMQQDVILKDALGEETRRPKTEQEIRQFATTLRSIVNTPTDFPSFDQWQNSAMNPFAKTPSKK